MTTTRLRLAFDATASIGSPTGVGVFANEVLQRAARSDGLDVSAFAISWRGRDALAAACPEGVRVVRRPMAARPLRAAWTRAAFPPIEWWTGDIDVVHGPNFVVPPARRAARVVTVHDLTPVRFPELCTSDTLAYPNLIASAIAGGAWVHTPSRFVADEVVAHFGADPSRVIPIHNGVFRPIVDDGECDAIAGRALSGHDQYVLALGTIEPRKDLPALVAAFDLLADQRPDLHLVVAGPDGWGVAEFDSAVADCAHRDRIVRLGWVDAASRLALLSGATALAFPSRYEGFGLPPLEAMAAGTPVVSTDAGALPEVLGDAAVMISAEALVQDRTAGVRALADALAIVIDEPAAARQDRVAKGRAHAAGYSWDATFAGLLELYRRAVNQRGG